MKSIKDEIELRRGPMAGEVSTEFGEDTLTAYPPLSSLLLNLINFNATMVNMMIGSVYNHETNIS